MRKAWNLVLVLTGVTFVACQGSVESELASAERGSPPSTGGQAPSMGGTSGGMSNDEGGVQGGAGGSGGSEPLSGFHVNDFADRADANPGDGICHTIQATCSLRAAVQEANLSSAPETIFLEAGLYQLEGEWGDDDNLSGDLDFGGTTTVIGESGTAIAGPGEDRVVHILTGAKVTFDTLAIRGGMFSWPSSPLRHGAGIFLEGQGELALTNVSVDNNENESGKGGGIASFGKITASDSRVEFNGKTKQEGPGAGGGLYLGPGSSTTLTDCLIANNQGQNGAGIYIEQALENPDPVDVPSLVIVNSTIHGNEALQFGGGILNNTAATVEIHASEITSNKAGMGGGIGNDGAGRFNVRASTITNNVAHVNGGGIGEVMFDAEFIQLFDSTLIDNQSDVGPNCHFEITVDETTTVGDLAGCTAVLAP